MGTIMLFNVWVLIWPNQKKVLGIVEANADEIAKAKFTAAMASRTNVVLIGSNAAVYDRCRTRWIFILILNLRR
jgi:hypothetical protein